MADALRAGRRIDWKPESGGISLEAAGDFEGAIACYDRALAADPKIGIRCRADQIRKRMS